MYAKYKRECTPELYPNVQLTGLEQSHGVRSLPAVSSTHCQGGFLRLPLVHQAFASSLTLLAENDRECGIASRIRFCIDNFFSSLFLILNVSRNLQLTIRFGFRDSAEVDLAEVLTGRCRGSIEVADVVRAIVPLRIERRIASKGKEEDSSHRDGAFVGE